VAEGFRACRGGGFSGRIAGRGISRGGGIPEILGGDLDELLFEPRSVKELREKLTSLIDWRRNRPDVVDVV
jgi:hypothetical protein